MILVIVMIINLIFVLLKQSWLKDSSEKLCSNTSVCSVETWKIMVKAMKMKAMKLSGYQLDRFDVGQVKAHMHHGLGSTSISQIMVKADGTSKFSEQAILDCMNKLKSNPKWRGPCNWIWGASQDNKGTGQTGYQVAPENARQRKSYSCSKATLN